MVFLLDSKGARFLLDSKGARSFAPSRGPHCVAAVRWSLLRGCVFRPDDACQKRFSWFPDWIQKVQTCVDLVDLVKSSPTSVYYVLTEIGIDTAENEAFKFHSHPGTLVSHRYSIGSRSRDGGG